MPVIGWIIIGSCALLALIWIVTVLADSGPQAPEVRLRERITDAHSEISDAFSDAREQMARRAGFEDTFRLGRNRGSRW
jgi:hypothetical protein